MARSIDLSSKLSAEDRKYLLARGREDLVLTNEAQFGNEAAQAATLFVPGVATDKAPGVLATPDGEFDDDPRRLPRVDGPTQAPFDPLEPADPDAEFEGFVERRLSSALGQSGAGPSSFQDQERPLDRQASAAQAGGEQQSQEENLKAQVEQADPSQNGAELAAAQQGDTSEAEESDEDNYPEWSNDELRAELKNRELPQSGNKAEMIARLREDDASEDDE